MIQTFIHPREIAAGITAERYDRQTLWTGVFFVIVFSGILQYALTALTPENELMVLLFSTPFVTTLVVGCGIIVLIFAVYFAGQMLGGTGHFPETIVVMTWLQFVQAAVSGVQILLIALSPQLIGLAALLGLFAAVGIFYATLHFIDVLHGYNSLWAAFGTLVISFLGLAVGLALIIAMIGGTAVQTGGI